HRRDGLRSADVVDLHQALAFLVDPLDEGLELAREVGAFLEGVDRPQRHLLGLGRNHDETGRDTGQQRRENALEFHLLPGWLAAAERRWQTSRRDPPTGRPAGSVDMIL